MITAEVLWMYDELHIPRHIKISSPYFVAEGRDESDESDVNSTEKPGHGKAKMTKQQKRDRSNKYEMWTASRERGKVIKHKKIEDGITKAEITEKYGISPNTVGAAERNGAVTIDGYYFVKTEQSLCRPAHLNMEVRF